MNYSTRTLAALLALSPLLIAQPVKAETDELKNPSWKEVTGTFDPKAREELRIPAFIDINGVTRRQGIVIYDVINSDQGYTRLETNCRTRRYRAVRLGFFESKTRVNYANRVEPWNKPSSSYQQAILNFACNLRN